MNRLTAALSAAATTWALAFAGGAAAAPAEQDIGMLYTQTAGHGSLTPVKGHKGRYVLTLRRVAPQVVWFADRPVRDAGQYRLREFVRAWGRFGFKADPPNAAVTVLGAKSKPATVVLELTRPRYRAKRRTLTYRARKLPAATGNLDHFERERDARIPRRFRAPSVFIDDARATVINGCILTGIVHCEHGNFAGADLTGTYLALGWLDYSDFTGANLAGVDLHWAASEFSNFSNANLSRASLDSAQLNYSNFKDADLSNAELDSADIVQADFTGAGLSGATLLSTVLTQTNFTNANLRGALMEGAHLGQADFTGADLTGAQLDQDQLQCATLNRTRMPNGTLKTQPAPNRQDMEDPRSFECFGPGSF
jgi:uncharacterized protein YjbI with pentapeptide repeats